MTDFNCDIPKNNGLPKLDKDYWKVQKTEPKENTPIFLETNVNAAFVDLDGISIFKGNI